MDCDLEQRERFERERRERRRLSTLRQKLVRSWEAKCATAKKYGRPAPPKPKLPEVESLQSFWARWKGFRNHADGREEIERLSDWTEWKPLPPEEVAKFGTKDHKKYCELWCKAHPITLEGVENLSKILIEPE